MNKRDLNTVEDKIVFLADNIIDQLTSNRTLLTFISKNLSWGVFKNALTSPVSKNDIDFYELSCYNIYNFITHKINLIF